MKLVRSTGQKTTSFAKELEYEGERTLKGLGISYLA